MLDVALNDWQGPEWIDVLESEVLGDLIVPQISLVQILFSEFVRMVLTRRELKFDLVLSLQVTCDVRMIAVVEALLLKNLLDAKDVFLQILRHFVQIVHVFVEWYHLDDFDEIDEIT